MSFIKTIQAYLYLGKVVFINNKKNTATFAETLRTKGFQIDEQLEKDILKYTVQSSLTNVWFTTLTNTEVSNKQKELALFLGAITPVSDNLTDQYELEYKDVWNAVQNINEDSPNLYKLARHLYDGMTALANPVFMHYINKTMEAQDESLLQLKTETLSKEKLQQITFDKGGYSTLLYRSMLDKNFVAGEEETIYLLGSILQLTNDAFDVYKDYTNKQQTLFTNTKDIEPLREMYMQKVSTFIVAFRALDYPKKNIEKALHQIMTVISRGVLSINQLIATQHTTNNIFEKEKYERKQLICDMEKPGNIWASVKITNKLLT